MTPIKGLTDRRRLPRVGKVRLGVKTKTDGGKEYPKAVDYFVVNVDESTPAEAAKAFHEVYGEKPRELDVVFPSDDPSQWADANLKMYSASWGLVCRGDGEEARAKWDLEGTGPHPDGIETGGWATRHTQAWVHRTIPCLGSECPMQQFDQPQCKAVMNLQFLLPRVRGVGAWQIDTSSFNSIGNLLSSVELIQSVTGGRIRGLPLMLRLVPKEVTPQGGTIKTKTVHVLELSLPQLTLQELLGQAARLPQEALMLPPAVNEEEAPEDLFPTSLTMEEGASEGEPPAAVEEAQEPSLPVEQEPATAEAALPVEAEASPPQEPAANGGAAEAVGRQVAQRIIGRHAADLKMSGWREVCEWLGLKESGDPIARFQAEWIGCGLQHGLSPEESAKIACEAIDAIRKELGGKAVSLPAAIAAVAPLSRLKHAGTDPTPEAAS